MPHHPLPPAGLEVPTHPNGTGAGRIGVVAAPVVRDRPAG